MRPDPCPEKARLFAELSNAMAAILVLNSREMAAVMTSEFGLASVIKVELQEARIRKDDSMSAYMRHVQEHGCLGANARSSEFSGRPPQADKLQEGCA